MGFDALTEIGRSIGSDVPFCIRGGTVLATGRGDTLRELDALPECFFVIAKPSFSVSTPELFTRIDCAKVRRRPDTDGILRAIEQGDLPGVAHRMYNVCEDVLPRGQGEIEELRDRMLDYHALGAMMTGTGSAVFGVFDDIQNAQNARRNLLRTHRETFLATPTGRLI
jgi:4-diphosphocytidyl-2-C-methyl-D-erythritol kinase